MTIASGAKSHVSGLAQPLVQQTLLYDALDNSHFLIFVADDRMQYLAVNATACELLGYTREELLSMRVTDVAVDDDAPGAFRELLSNGSHQGLTHVRASDGTLLPFSYNASEIHIAGLPYYLSIGFVAETVAPAPTASSIDGAA
jgi:PAS domain S-box-containing protein